MKKEVVIEDLLKNIEKPEKNAPLAKEGKAKSLTKLVNKIKKVNSKNS